MEPRMNTDVEIKPVQSRPDLLRFIRVPWGVNAGDPHWVPPLIQDRQKLLDTAHNPFFKHNPSEFFLAYQNGQPVGRTAVFLNHQHNLLYGDQTGFFGFFDALREPAAFEGLMGAAETWLRARGCDRILGPVCPDTNKELGVLVDGLDAPPFFMLAHNPPYYDEMLRGLGYAKARDFYSYFLRTKDFIAGGKLARVAERVSKRYPIRLRGGNMKAFEAELQIIGQIYNDAFAHHWGFVPMTPEEMQFLAADLKLIVDPELVLIAEYAGEPAGFLLAVPNINEVLIKIRDGRLFPFGWLTFLLNRRRIKGVRVLTVAVKQKYQAFGFGSLLYVEAYRRIVARGYSHAEMSWVAEDNLMMNRAARLMGGEIYKTYRMYQKEL